MVGFLMLTSDVIQMNLAELLKKITEACSFIMKKIDL